MKNLFAVLIIILFGPVAFAQEITLTSPSGLSEPYEVAAGTEVTVQWYYYDEAPTYMFTYDLDPGSLPGDYQFSPNAEWTQHSDWVDNGDGTYDLTVTVNSDTWFFGAYNSFSGNSYSNVINVNMASSVVINFEDGVICASGDTETLTVDGSFTTFQWYKDATILEGETTSNYDATTAGSYYVMADDVQSNILTIIEQTIDFTGNLSVDGAELTLTADAGMDAYQWYSGTDVSTMTEIVGATTIDYIATISTDLTYYHVEGTIASCVITSVDKAVSESIFTASAISISADTNASNQVCDGTPVYLSIDENTTSYAWYKNGNEYNTYSTSITIYGAYADGDYHVETSPAEWPNVSLVSEVVTVTHLEVISPILTGVDNYANHCAGDDITIYLADEGYTYTWYAHSEYSYTEDDLIDVPTGIYQFTFSEGIRVTLVASFQGCESSSTLVMNSYSDESMYVGISNYDQQYLCIDSTAHLGVNYGYENFIDFQWYEKDGEDWVIIAGETTHQYDATEPGFYRLNAISASCATANVESNEYEVKDYLDRNMYLWADQTEMCVGDTATLNFSAYSWTNIQWLEAIMVIGSGGYEKSYIPLIGAGTESTTDVTKFNSYIVKAKHNSCPNGIKDTSDPIIIRPSVNPTVSLDPLIDPNDWKEMLWDSAAFYLFCDNYPVSITLEEGFDSYQWHEQIYQGIDDYVIGDAIDGATTNTYETNALVQWVTAVVELDGCVGQSDPILLDTWVFASPAIASYNNSEICQEGDSTLFHIAFPGTWVYIEWYLDGVLIEGANNDSIYGFEEGMYTVTAYPEACPDFGYSSGIGPILTLLEAEIIEDEDYFYAIPELGFYEYQWYINGEAYENNIGTPWILFKDGLPSGIISCEVTNPEPCTAMSNEIVWNPLGIGENEMNSLSIYPNPTNGLLTINGIDPNITNSIILYNSLGKVLRTIEINNDSFKLDISDLPNGMYLIRVRNNDGSTATHTVNKL